MKLKKFAINWGLPLIVALMLAVPINLFIVTPKTVEATTIKDLPQNSVVLLNKISSSFTVNDKILLKDDSTARVILSVNGNELIISDKDNATMTINKNDILGKVMIKF